MAPKIFLKIKSYINFEYDAPNFFINFLANFATKLFLDGASGQIDGLGKAPCKPLCFIKDIK
jgi:hypothetical protein